MNREENELVEAVIENYHVGYAYLYPSGNGQREEYVFDMTPENMADFIGRHPKDAKKILLTDLADRLLLDASAGFIDHCPDQQLCNQVLTNLIPILTGEKAAGSFPMVTREAFDEYCQLEEEAAMRMEIGMM